MTIRKVLLGALFVLFATQAHAANKMWVSEYVAIGGPAGVNAQIAQEPVVTDQTPVNFAGGATQSAVFNSKTNFVRIVCDTQCSVAFGTNPTATTSSKLLPALIPEYFAVPKGASYRISVIASP